MKGELRKGSALLQPSPLLPHYFIIIKGVDNCQVKPQFRGKKYSLFKQFKLKRISRTLGSQYYLYFIIKSIKKPLHFLHIFPAETIGLSCYLC